jgi:hypothetical protein
MSCWQGGEGRVNEPAQRVEGLATFRHRAFGAAQQVPVPVHQARGDHAVGGVDEPPGRVPGEQVRPLAHLDDDPGVDGHRARPVHLPLRVHGEQPAARDQRVHRDRPGQPRLASTGRPGVVVTVHGVGHSASR